MSDYKGTFLCGNHIAAWKIVLFVNHFLSHLRDHKTIFQYLGFFTNSSIDWRSFCSEVCLAWFKNQKPIRGEEIGVEIDDTLIKRRNYERGRVLSQMWLFCRIERANKRHFVVALTGDIAEKRDKAIFTGVLTKPSRGL